MNATFFTAIALVLLSGQALAAEKYSELVQKKVAHALIDQARSDLKQAVEQYNDKLDDRETLLKKLDKSDFEFLKKKYHETWEKQNVRASFDGDRIILDTKAGRLAIGLEDYFTDSVQFNGMRFLWDARKSIRSNMASFSKFVRENALTSQRSPAPGLINQAYADDIFYLEFPLELSMLTLRIAIAEQGEKTDVLYKLGAKIREELASCQSDASVDYSDRNQPLSEEVEELNKLLNPNNPITRVKDCKSLQEFAQYRTYTIKEPKSDGTFATIKAKSKQPQTLCSDLSKLSHCLKKKASISSPKTDDSPETKKSNSALSGSAKPNSEKPALKKGI